MASLFVYCHQLRDLGGFWSTRPPYIPLLGGRHYTSQENKLLHWRHTARERCKRKLTQYLMAQIASLTPRNWGGGGEYSSNKL